MTFKVTDPKTNITWTVDSALAQWKLVQFLRKFNPERELRIEVE